MQTAERQPVQTITLYWDCAQRASVAMFAALPQAVQELGLPQGYRVRYWPVAMAPAEAEPLPPAHAERVAQARQWLLARSLALPQGLPNRYSCGVALQWVWPAAQEGHFAAPPLVALPELVYTPDPVAVQAHGQNLTRQAQHEGVGPLPCVRIGDSPDLVLSLADLANSLM